jgi:hypothetical protein
VAPKVNVPGAGEAKIIKSVGGFPAPPRHARDLLHLLVTGLLLYLVALFLLPFEIPYGQHHLNRLWEHVATERERASLGMRGPVGA